jgi:DNA-binding transcriptional ArsR family regulator
MLKGRTEADPTDPSAIFAALGDRTRLALLARLGAGRKYSIVQLSAESRLTRQAITKHLHVLEGAGLVRNSRSGRESRYALCPEAIAAAKSYLDTVSAQWEDALGRLRSFVEK